MKNRYIILLFTILFALTCLRASVFAQTGASCSDPIPVGRDYKAAIAGSCELWYVANTFDLPLTMEFRPDNEMGAAPYVELDFSCESGVYEDTILCSLFCRNNTVHTNLLPYKATPQMTRDEEGKLVYYLAMGKLYRDMLLQAGISYNVEVYVMVIFPGSGSISIVPDNTFANCMDNGKYLHSGDTVQVKANDLDRFYIAPYTRWEDDSIRYVWEGKESVQVAIMSTCEVDPTDAMDDRRIDVFTLNAPRDTLKINNDEINYYIREITNDGGVFFLKTIASSDGILKLEKIPGIPPEGNAIELKYNKATPIFAKDTTTLYAISTRWTGGTRLVAPTNFLLKMYIGLTPDFTPSTAVDSFRYAATDVGRELCWDETQLASVMSLTSENYIYVRFACNTNTKVTPEHWTPSDCYKKTTLLSSKFDVKSRSTVVYRLYYKDWEGGDMTFSWSYNLTCPMYFGDTCVFPTTTTNPHVLNKWTIPGRGSVTVSSADLVSWENRLDPDGCLYVRFYPTYQGTITITTNRPAEEDPQCVPLDSVLTIEEWDSYEWRGTTYTESGDYSETISHPDGCDTTYTLHLTIHTTTLDTHTETGCDSILYNGTKYTTSGTYTDTIYDAAGDRTIVTLELTIRYATAGEETVTACGSYEWHGETYTESGVFLDTISNAAGCDSVVTLHLTIAHPYNETLQDIKVCDSYVWGDTTIYDSGTYTRRFKSVYGCDSVVTQTITIGLSYLDTEDKISAYDSYTWIDGQTYHASIFGPAWELSTIDGCDSLITLNLTIRHLLKDTFTRTLCETELPYEWYGKYYTQSGTYSSDTILGQAVNKIYMDTVHTVNLTVLPTSTGDTTATACESFTWYGTTYTQSAEPKHTFTNVHGCDSTVTLHLTIHHGVEAAPETVKACDSYKWHGVNYTESGEYKDTLKTVHQCDSICVLHLTLGHTTYGEWTEEACNSYTSPRGITYTESGDYTEKGVNAAGCDSIITLHLTIRQNCAVYDTVYFCYGYNTVHEERISDVLISRYLPYSFESPMEWDYMEGVILAGEPNRTLMDFNRAESNLRNHYVGELTPVESVTWSIRYAGAARYTPIVVEENPQWVGAGKLAVQIYFRCGQMFNNEFPMEVDEIESSRNETVKRVENGQVIILRNGVRYNILGTKINEL